MRRPDNALLAFMGAAVDHEMQSVTPPTGDVQPAQQPSQMDAGKLAQDVLALAVPQLCATIQRHFDERFDALATRLQAQRGDNIVNLNVRSPKRPLDQTASGPPLAIAANDGGRPLPVAKFLDEKGRQDHSWTSVRKSYMQNFTNVAMALHKKRLADAGLRPQYVWQNQRRQVYYGESHRDTLEEASGLTSAHREELVAFHNGVPQRRPVSAAPSVIELLRCGA